MEKTHRSKATPTMALGLFVWSFGAIFYLLGFFHRVAPAVITAELMQDSQINASALGNLSAFYFYSYVAMQIPTGILADRWGPRRLLTLGAMMASIGAVMFGLASEISLAGAGRFLIGGSVAVAFVALLKVATCWFAPNRFALVSGLALFFGIVGAVFAGTPLRILVDSFGWRNVILFSAAATLLVGIGTWAFVRDYPHEKGFQDFPNTTSGTDLKANRRIATGLLEVFAYRNTWLLFLIPGGLVGCVLTFSGLWGVPFLTMVYGLSPVFSASLTSSLLVAWALGGPFFGWLSDRLQNRKRIYIAGCGVAALGWTEVTLIEKIPLGVLVPPGRIGSHPCDHRFRLGEHYYQLCVRQGIGADSLFGNGCRSSQYGRNDRTHDLAAGSGVGLGQHVRWRSFKRRSGIRCRSLSKRLFNDAGLGCILLHIIVFYPRDQLQADG